MNLPLTLISETTKTVTLGWTPVLAGIGYRYQSSASAPKWSHTWNPATSSVRFQKAEWYVVEALGVAAEGRYPAPAPEPQPWADPPLPPREYVLPAGALRVTTSATLVTALQSSTPQDIVLADGVYDHSTYVRLGAPHRVYAEHLGGATVRFGIEIANGDSLGVRFQGLGFLVHDPRKTFLGRGAIIDSWGSMGDALTIRDCWLDGSGSLAYGVFALNPRGLQCERIVASNFTDVAIRANDNMPATSVTPFIDRLWDIDVDTIHRTPPGSGNGTCECALFIGHPVKEGVRRIRTRNCSWAGIIVANNAWDTTYLDLTIDMGGPFATVASGIYLEHKNRNLAIEHFEITNCKYGINAEWDQGQAGNYSTRNLYVRDGRISASNPAGGSYSGHRANVYLDEGSTDFITIENVKMDDADWACIGYTNTPTTSFTSVDFSGREPGAVKATTAHISDDNPQERL